MSQKAKVTKLPDDLFLEIFVYEYYILSFYLLNHIAYY